MTQGIKAHHKARKVAVAPPWYASCVAWRALVHLFAAALKALDSSPCAETAARFAPAALTKAKAPKKRRSQRHATQESTVTQCLCRFTALLHLLLRSIAQIPKETNPSILRKAVLAALCVKARRSATTRNSPYRLTSAKCRQGRNATRACKDRRIHWQERP